MTRQWIGSRLTELAGGLIGGFTFAAGVWLFRGRLRQDNHAVKVAEPRRYDPVGAVVVSLENLRRALGKQ